MRQGGPTITAPISRRRTGAKSSPIGMICAALSAIFAFGGTFILAMAMISSHNNNDVSDGSTTLRKKGASLRQSMVDDEQTIEKRDLLSGAKGLMIHTHIGDIRIHFTPELAGDSSIKYVTDVVQAASAKQNNGMGYNSAETMNGRRITDGFMCEKCKLMLFFRCNFYRAEKKLLLQGIMTEESVPRHQVVLGPCPLENYKPKSECPKHDPNCGCHGPVMTKGMVGWAGGGGGPDFFINTFAKPVDWWENQHTVWGEIRDEKSMKVVESAYDLPAHMSSMRMLNEKVEFSLELF
ncbi:hypothetical protein ACHAXR_008545 [Thalassiosira sp. AJA248-18]